MSTYPCDCAALTNGKDQHSLHCAIFKCGSCGGQASISPKEGDTFCQECCPDHDYKSEPGAGQRCVNCHAEPPLDWYEE